jgi:hypothetical protein
VKAKRRITTAKDVRVSGKRTPTTRKVRPLLGSGSSLAGARPRAAAPARTSSSETLPLTGAPVEL